METGGRFSRECLDFIDSAAGFKAQQDPRPLRRQASRAWRTRWTTLLSVAAQDAIAATLVQDGTKLLDAAPGEAPTAVDLWLDHPFGCGGGWAQEEADGGGATDGEEGDLAAGVV